MISVILQGGLGNQMFQYAAGRALALEKKTSLRLLTHRLNIADKNITLRKYELNCYSINGIVDVNVSKQKDLVRKVFFKLMGCNDPKLYKEPHFQYDDFFFKNPSNVILDGYWQSEKYFSNIGDVIKNDFKLNASPNAANTDYIKFIESENAVSIHIRRGDYVTNTFASSFHGVCTQKYYLDAVDAVAHKIANPYFFIFTDDKNWVKSNFSIKYPFVIVDINDAENSQLDLNLMRNCKHHIIANSSFSWWGAWLCNNPNKMVIAPKQWFVDSKIDTSTLLPSNWYRI